MLTSDGGIKLTNLGLSTQLSDPEQKLQNCLGSPCWMAPEVAACKFKVKNSSFPGPEYLLKYKYIEI